MPYFATARIAFVLLAVTGADAQFTAAPGSPFAVGAMPLSVATGDFNRDGKLDLVTANSSDNTVTVLLGNGSGGFTAAPAGPFAVGTNPQSVATADFNGDGIPDLATANSGDNTVTVLLANGSGGFTQALGSPITVGTSPIFVTVADFNGDGIPDIVVANAADNTLTVLLCNGTGGFTEAPGSPVTVGLFPQSAIAADLNGDGIPDIVTANYSGNSVTVLLGNGSGGFTEVQGSPFAVGLNPASLAAGDLNQDGKLDIVVANSGDNTVSVLLGDGMGGFTAAANSPFAVGSKPWSVAVKDCNGDGAPDILTANSGANTASVLLGDGAGGFTRAAGSPFAVGAAPSSLTAGDFNGDGKPDFAVANLGGNGVSILLNSLPAITVNPVAPTFSAGVGLAAPASIPVSVSSTTTGSTYTVSSNQPWLTPTPVSNATGGVSTEHLSANQATLAAGMYTGTVRFKAPNFFDAASAVTFSVAGPSGTLQPSIASPFPVGTAPHSVAVGDFNLDGVPDLVTANIVDGTLTVLLGDGSGGFTPAPGSPFAVGASPASVAVGDFNGDGKPDLVTANSGDNTVTLLLGDGSGGFTPATGSPFAVGAGPLSIAVGDFNRDGKLDLVTANHGANGVTVLLGNGSSGLTPAPGSPFTVGASPEYVAVADLNGDGNPDLVTVNSANFAAVLLGNGSGRFAAVNTFPVGTFPQSVAVTDFNGDGKPDIVAANSASNTVTVLLGNGSGGFTAAAGSPFAVGMSPQSVAAVDVNGDGRPDIITANIGDNTVTVLLGNGSGGFTAAQDSPFAAGANPFSVVVADFNADGRPDVATANVGAGIVTVLLGAAATTSSALSTTAAATIAYGTTVPLTLRVTLPSGGFNAPTGTAAFQDGGTALGAAAQTTSPYTFAATGLAAGAHTLTAAYGGDSASSSSTSNTLSLTVMAANQTITFGTLAAKAFGSAPFAVVATASSGLAVAFASTTPAVCTVLVATVTLLGAGTCTIQASQPGSGNYAAATPVNQNLHVTQATQIITFGPLSNTALGTASLTVVATASSGLAVSFSAAPASVCTAAGVTVTLVSTGVCTIQALQAGDANYTAAATVSQHFSVTTLSQTITFGGPLANLTFGAAPFTVGATASSGLAVAFTSSTSSVCSVLVATVTLVGAGACTIRALQAGNTIYASAPPVNQSFTVAPALQTISFGPLMGQPFGSPPFQVGATASSTLQVTFTSTTLPVCKVLGSTVTLLGAGTCTIRAAQTGNTNYAAATPVDQTFTVAQASQVITFAGLADKAFGIPPFTVSATASSGLAVGFTSTTASTCTIAAGTVTLVSVGSCTVHAAQAGNTNYALATPVDQTFNVTQASQTITFATLPNKAFGAAPFTVSATSSSGLPVAITSNSGVCTITGSSVTLVITGSCTLTASQPGNTNYAAATQVAQTFTVTPAIQTITFAALPNTALGSAPFALTATASSGLPVTFVASPAAICSLAAGTVTLAGVGTCTIQASQAGDSNYAAATAVSQHFSVTPQSQTITFAALADQVFGIAPFALTATASSGLTVIFTSTTLPVCTVAAGTVTVVSVGTCAIQAAQAGDTNYAAAKPVKQTFAVSVGPVTVGSVLNAGSYASVPIAADGYTAIFGSNFSTATAQNKTLTLPTTLAGATVTITDANGASKPALLYYVSPTQINFVVPEGLAAGTATVTVTNTSGNAGSFTTSIAQVSPSLFTADSSGAGAPAADALAYTSGTSPQVTPVFSCTGTPPVCTAVPLSLGTASSRVFLELFGTGIRGRSSLSAVSVTVNGVALAVTYAAAQSTYPGLDQVNVLLDRSLVGKGSMTLQLTVAGVAANPVMLNIK